MDQGQDTAPDASDASASRRTSFVVVAAVGALVVAGLVVNSAQGAPGADVVTSDATIEAGVESADLRPCPGAEPVGQLQGGDPVSLTGRTEDGVWLQLRTPDHDEQRLWIEADLVVVTTPDDLPIGRCGDVDLAIELIGGAELVLTPRTTTTTTTTVVGADGSTTSAPGGSTTSTTAAPGGPAPTTPGTAPTTRPPTTRPAPTTTTTRPRPPAPTTTRPTTTTTTAPPDLTPPAIEGFERSVSSLFESGSAGCQLPNQVQLSARVSDPSGLYAVRLVWRITNPGRTVTYVNGNVAMQPIGDDVWRGALGPFGQVVPSGVQAVLEWRVQAYDNSPAHNQTIGDAPVNRWPAVVAC